MHFTHNVVQTNALALASMYEFCPGGHFVLGGFCPCGILSSEDFVLAGFCGILAREIFPGDFVLIPIRGYWVNKQRFLIVTSYHYIAFAYEILMFLSS